MKQSRTRRRTIVLVAALLWIGAFGVRLAYVGESQHTPGVRTPNPILDIGVAWEAARNIRRGVTPNFELRLSSAPLYPYWLAGAQAILGERVILHRVVMAFLGSLRFLAVFALALWLTGRVEWSAAAVIVLGGLPSLIYADTVLLKSAFEVTLLVLVVLCCVAATRRERPRHWVWGGLTGLVLGLCALNQLGSILYLPAILLFGVLHRGWARPERARFVLGAAGMFLTLFIPFQLRQRDAAADDRCLPRAGFEMRLGYNERAGGTFVQFPGIDASPAGHAFDSRLLAEEELGRPLTPAEADRHHMARAWQYVIEHPGRAVLLASAKLAYFVGNFEPRDVHYLPWLRAQSHVLSATPFGFAWLFVLGVLGFVAMWRQGQRSELLLITALFVAIGAANCLTFVSVRSRLPATVPLALLAGPGLVMLVDVARATVATIRRRDARGLAKPAACVLLAVVAGWLSLRDLASPRQERHSLDRARQNALRAVAAERDAATLASTGLAELETRARVLTRLDRHSEAFQALGELIRGGGGDLDANRTYIRYLLWLGDHAGAGQVLARIRAADEAAYRALLDSSAPRMRASLLRLAPRLR